CTAPARSGAEPAACATTTLVRSSCTSDVASSSTVTNPCDLLNWSTASTDIFWCTGLSAQPQYLSVTFLRTEGGVCASSQAGAATPVAAIPAAPMVRSACRRDARCLVPRDFLLSVIALLLR